MKTWNFYESAIVWLLNTLRPRQNGRHFADDTFKRIFLRENVRMSIKISLKFVPKSPIDNIAALFQIMAWCRPGDKPLSEAMKVSLLTHICVARPQWVKRPPIHFTFYMISDLRFLSNYWKKCKLVAFCLEQKLFVKVLTEVWKGISIITDFLYSSP